MAWRITFMNGDTVKTANEVDKLQISVNETLMFAYSTRNYGPDKLVATYNMANVRSWEKIGR